MQHDNLLRFEELKAKLRLSRSTIWRMERNGTFPARRQISARAVAWSEVEVDQWLAQRPAVRS